MKPVYCNNVSMSCNPKTGEVSISFAHIYTAHNISVAANGLTDVSGKVAEEEAHVIMTREAFLGLKRVVDTIAEKLESGE